MLVLKYTPNIFLTTSAHVCVSHPSKIFAALKQVRKEIGNNCPYV